MKSKIIKIIKILGFGFNELIVDLPLSSGHFDSIEYVPDEDIILLHIFEDDNLDISFDFDDLPEEDKLKIWKILSIFYN